MTAVANAADTKSESLASDVPPGLYAEKRISSFLKSVDFNTTLAPLDSFHSTIPSDATGFSSTTVPAGGKFETSGSEEESVSGRPSS